MISNKHTKWAMLGAAALVLSMAPRAMGDNLYVQTNLVSNVPGLAAVTDPGLVNPWGVANSATSPYWVSDQGTNESTLYNGLGAPQALIVAMPAGGPPSGPTGQVQNSAGATNFVLGDGTGASFMFATLSGQIDGWNGGEGTTAVIAVASPGSVFTGLALLSNGSSSLLFAADFATGGGIQVFDSHFHSVALTGSFTDPHAVAGYAPYNVQVIGGNVYVTYAIPNRGAMVGAGLGYVDVFDTNGNFLQRVATGGALNAPWGIVMATSNFGSFSNDLLVGNFGDGTINAYSLDGTLAGTFQGALDGPGGTPLSNPGLWTIEFENTNTGSAPNTLLFTAGIDGERDGLLGIIQATPEPSTLLLVAVGMFGMAFITWKRRRENSVRSISAL